MLRRLLTFFGWPLLVLPTAMLWLGIACNFAAMGFNGNVMPVLNPSCANFSDNDEDFVHKCGDSKTRVKFLVDRFPITDEGIASIGDTLQQESDGLRLPCLILWLTMLGVCLIRRQKFYWEESSVTDKKDIRSYRGSLSGESCARSNYDRTY